MPCICTYVTYIITPYCLKRLLSLSGQCTASQTRGGKNNRFLDESRFGRGWFWISYMLIDSVMLTECKRRNSEVQRLNSWWRAHNKKHGMCHECLYSSTTHGWNSLRHLFTPSGSRAAWRLLLAVSCRLLTRTIGYFCHSTLRSNGYLMPSFPAK